MKLNAKPYLPVILLLTLPALAFSNEKILPMKTLKQCPDSPNCVSSQSHSALHKISPSPYKSPTKDTLQRIKKTILALPRTTLIKEEALYLHIEFKSFIFRFIDDVEIVLDDSEKMIHFRSASRVGHSDLGANRRRIEEIKAKIAAY